MASESRNFQLQKLGSGDPFGLNDFAFSDRNIEVIDTLLKYLADHTHDGAPPPQEGPDTPPALDLVATTVGAGFPSETTIYYRYAHVAPDGTESVASAQSQVTTPEPLPVPEAPVVEWGSASGSLPPGSYLYRVSVWTGTDTLETPAGPIGAVLIPSTASVARAVLTLPDLPTGGDGWNVYRRSPGGVDYQLIASVPASEGTTFNDGGIAPSGIRFAPTYDTSQNSANVTVTVDSVPDGWSWRVYRTLVDGSWGQSLLDTMPDDELTFTDTGMEAFDGSPREAEINFPTIPPVGYTPGDPGDWEDVPDTVPDALDMLAAGGVSGGGSGGGTSAPVVELASSGTVTMSLGRVNTLSMAAATTVEDPTVPSGHAGWAILDVEDADAYTLTTPAEWDLPALTGRALVIIQYVHGQDPIASVIDASTVAAVAAVDVSFTPTEETDWTTDPDDVQAALDELAAREGGGVTVDAAALVDLSAEGTTTVVADLSTIGFVPSVLIGIDAIAETVQVLLPDLETVNHAPIRIIISRSGSAGYTLEVGAGTVDIPGEFDLVTLDLVPFNGGDGFYWYPYMVQPVPGLTGGIETIDMSASADNPVEVDLSAISPFTRFVAITGPAADVDVVVTALPTHHVGDLWVGAMATGSNAVTLQLPDGLGVARSPGDNALAWLSAAPTPDGGWMPTSSNDLSQIGIDTRTNGAWERTSLSDAIELLVEAVSRPRHYDVFVDGGVATVHASIAWTEFTLDDDYTIELGGARADSDNLTELWVIQDGTGGHTVTWDAAIQWPGGIAPTLPTTAGARSLIEFRSIDEGATWYGALRFPAPAGGAVSAGAVTFAPGDSGDWTTSPATVEDALDELAAREGTGGPVTADDVGFSPTTSGDWTSSPTDVEAALDELAARPSGGTVAAADITDATSVGIAVVTASDTAAARAAIEAAPATRSVGTALATTGTVDLDMAALHGSIQAFTLTGNPTFTTSNRSAGREVTLVIAAGGSGRTITWPSWIAVGASLPTSLASGKTMVVSVTMIDSTDSAAIATAAVQP